jgi:hypothetical protein
MGQVAAQPTVVQSTTTNVPPTTTTAIGVNRDRLEKYVVKYIHHCTQYVKKSAETRVRLAKAQMEEYKALQDFEQVANPLQWSIHLVLKPKIKTWSIKNKNYCMAQKRVEYDLPPKFISNTTLTFKIDETILSSEEAQVTYNDMRKITSDYRTKAMELYVLTAARESQLLKIEIDRIIENFPKRKNSNEVIHLTDHDDDGNGGSQNDAVAVDTASQNEAEAANAAFIHYHNLREKRFNLEVEQSFYFLDIQRVENENNNNQEEQITIPTRTRSLGEDSLLQI